MKAQKAELLSLGENRVPFPGSGRLLCSLRQFGCHFLLWETLMGMLLVNTIYDAAAGERKPVLECGGTPELSTTCPKPGFAGGGY